MTEKCPDGCEFARDNRGMVKNAWRLVLALLTLMALFVVIAGWNQKAVNEVTNGAVEQRVAQEGLKKDVEQIRRDVADIKGYLQRADRSFGP